ncbi:hypothetical protein [Streptomyces sp. 6N223]|uniref:hypothetical protein n=1 Tax=Streptomyces sp. 6N223 TaxID=3457412 RepID=UPI003FD27BE7
MDQGLAAVLGALVGALATAGGAYLPARSAERLHKRQARRDAYMVFLHETEMICSRLWHASNALCDEENQATWDAVKADRALTEMEDALNNLDRHAAGISLEGPESVIEETDKITLIATSAVGFTRLAWNEYKAHGNLVPDDIANEIFRSLSEINAAKRTISPRMRKLV